MSGIIRSRITGLSKTIITNGITQCTPPTVSRKYYITHSSRRSKPTSQSLIRQRHRPETPDTTPILSSASDYRTIKIPQHNPTPDLKNTISHSSNPATTNSHPMQAAAASLDSRRKPLFNEVPSPHTNNGKCFNHTNSNPALIHLP